MKINTLKLLSIMGVSALSASLSFGQVNGYWEHVGSVAHVLQNVSTFGSGTPILEFDVLTNSNTRLRIFNDGKWQVNPWSGAGGFISEPAGQGSLATFKVRAGGTSGIVSYSFQNGDWGQNIQSYVGRQKTVSYVVNWNGSDRFYVAGQGWVYANGAYFSSDRRLKENIKPIQNALDKVLLLKGYTYNFKPETLCKTCDPDATSPQHDMKTEIGLLADEVEKVVPEVVRVVENDKMAVAYQNLVALLIESTKEQQKMINSLQAQMAKIMASGKYGNSGNPALMDVNKFTTVSPNPFTTSTDIEYYLVSDGLHAQIKVWDMQGIERKSFSLKPFSGNGGVTLQGSDLPITGNYTCALIVDGQIVDAKTIMFK